MSALIRQVRYADAPATATVKGVGGRAARQAPRDVACGGMTAAAAAAAAVLLAVGVGSLALY